MYMYMWGVSATCRFVTRRPWRESTAGLVTHMCCTCVHMLDSSHNRSESKCVCVYECACVSMCVRVCVHVCMYQFSLGYMSACICTCTSTGVHVHVRVRVHVLYSHTFLCRSLDADCDADDDDVDDDYWEEEDMFSRLEATRAQLERELGCDVFMKAYKTVQVLVLSVPHMQT